MFEALLARGEHLAEVQAQRALLRFLNGVDWLIRDPKQVVGRTPYEVVHQRDKLEVRRYHHGHAHVGRAIDLPVLLVPPLMVKPFIFDLFPGRSLVRFLLDRGFAVYLVDFGEPDAADAYVTLDDYVLDWIPTACRAGQGRRRAAASCRCSATAWAACSRLMHLGATPRPQRAQPRHHRRAARRQQDGPLRLDGEDGRRPDGVPRQAHRQRPGRPVERRCSAC